MKSADKWLAERQAKAHLIGKLFKTKASATVSPSLHTVRSSVRCNRVKPSKTLNFYNPATVSEKRSKSKVSVSHSVAPSEIRQNLLDQVKERMTNKFGPNAEPVISSLVDEHLASKSRLQPEVSPL